MCGVMCQSIRSSLVQRSCVAAIAVAVCFGPLSPALQAADDPWFGRDKALHATAATGLAAGGYGGAAMVLKTSRTRTRVVSGLVISLGAGAAKEWWDRGRGTPSWRDFAWDGVGAAAGTTVAWLIDRARHRARSSRQGEPAATHRAEPGGAARLLTETAQPGVAGELARSGRAAFSTAPAVSLACPCP